MANDIFICFSSKDEFLAELLYDELTSKGIACWIATRDVPIGTNYQEAIVTAISRSRVLLLLFTENANSSIEVPRELALASQARKPILPLRLDKTAPTPAFRYSLATHQWFDLSEVPRDNIRTHTPRIIAAISFLIQDINRPDPTATNQAEFGRKNHSSPPSGQPDPNGEYRPNPVDHRPMKISGRGSKTNFWAPVLGAFVVLTIALTIASIFYKNSSSVMKDTPHAVNILIDGKSVVDYPPSGDDRRAIIEVKYGELLRSADLACEASKFINGERVSSSETYTAPNQSEPSNYKSDIRSLSSGKIRHIETDGLQILDCSDDGGCGLRKPMDSEQQTEYFINFQSVLQSKYGMKKDASITYQFLVPPQSLLIRDIKLEFDHFSCLTILK